MAVAEVEKPEKTRADGGKGDGGSGSGGAGLPGPLGWLPRKIAEGRAYLTEVRSELKKSTWPSRHEVYTTTLVVVATSVFFGFYLWGLDLVLSRLLSAVFKRQF
jgi:preprotein translocase subunit SecE